MTIRHDRAWPRHDAIQGVPVIRVAGWPAGGRERLPTPLRKLAYLMGLLAMGWTLWWHRRRYDVLSVYQLNLLAFPAALACLLAGKPLVISPRCADSGRRAGAHQELSRLPAPLAPDALRLWSEARKRDMGDPEGLGAPALRAVGYLLRRTCAAVVVLSSRIWSTL